MVLSLVKIGVEITIVKERESEIIEAAAPYSFEPDEEGVEQPYPLESVEDAVAILVKNAIDNDPVLSKYDAHATAVDWSDEERRRGIKEKIKQFDDMLGGAGGD